MKALRSAIKLRFVVQERAKSAWIRDWYDDPDVTESKTLAEAVEKMNADARGPHGQKHSHRVIYRSEAVVARSR